MRGNRLLSRAAGVNCFSARSIRVISERSSTPFYNPGTVSGILLIFREYCTVSLWLNLAALVSDMNNAYSIAVE